MWAAILGPRRRRKVAPRMSALGDFRFGHDPTSRASSVPLPLQYHLQRLDTIGKNDTKYELCLLLPKISELSIR